MLTKTITITEKPRSVASCQQEENRNKQKYKDCSESHKIC